MNCDGKVIVPAAREIVTRPSSSGWRIVSKTLRLNSGNSSKNKTPWCASEISPGVGLMLPPSKPGVARGVMRRAKRPLRHERLSGFQQADDAVDFRRFQRLVQSQRRQNRREPFCQHGFARARRADEQNIVSAGSGDFQRALHVFLAFDFGKIAVVIVLVLEKFSRCPLSPARFLFRLREIARPRGDFGPE